MKFTPKYATPWLNNGVAHSRLKRYDEALADYHHAQELDPAEPLIWNNIASVLCQDLQRYDEALAVCDEALARGIAIAGIWAIKGDALHALGREAEAQAAEQRAEELGR